MKSLVSKAAKLWSINVLAMVFVVGLLAGQASAETIRLQTANTAAQTGSFLNLDLSGSSGVQAFLPFSTTVANSTVIIRFNAECSIEGPATNWVDIDIVVDPAGGGSAVTTVPPTTGDNAFCSGNHTATRDDGWVSATAQASMIIVPTGTHLVGVLATGRGVNPNFRIDDLSLTVETQP
jgi:hypothetical protein